jgi:hypothetical protein
MSGMGETLADFIRGLYWLAGCLAAVIVVLLGVIVWLVLR